MARNDESISNPHWRRRWYSKHLPSYDDYDDIPIDIVSFKTITEEPQWTVETNTSIDLISLRALTKAEMYMVLLQVFDNDLERCLDFLQICEVWIDRDMEERMRR